MDSGLPFLQSKAYPLIIGLSGKIGSGKDTIAELFVKHLPGCKHIKLAHKLQDFTALTIGVYKEDLSHRQLFSNRDWKENTVVYQLDDIEYTPRLLMQKIGTECMRNGLSTNFWTNQLFQTVMSEYRKDSNASFVISDVRFPNELDFVKNNCGYMIYVDSDVPDKDYSETHSSESHHEYLRLNSNFMVNNIYYFNQQLGYSKQLSLNELENQVEELAGLFRSMKR